MKKKNRENAAYLFVLPFVIVFLIFSVYPVFRTLYLSFTEYKGYGEPVFNGLANYTRVLKDKFFWRALRNTVKMWSLNIKYKLRGLAIFRAVYYLPNLIAATSVAFLFKTLLDWKYGTFNQILLATGIVDQQINWLGQRSTAWAVIGVIQAWMWFGNSFIILMAGVQGIPSDYFEAAAIDGAGRWKVFGSITLPLLRPILLYVAVTSLIGGLQLFDLPFLMNGAGGPSTAGEPGGTLQTVVMYLYKFGFETHQVGFASAIAYTLFFIILFVSIMEFKFIGGKED